MINVPGRKQLPPGDPGTWGGVIVSSPPGIGSQFAVLHCPVAYAEKPADSADIQSNPSYTEVPSSGRTYQSDKQITPVKFQLLHLNILKSSASVTLSSSSL